MEFRHHDQLSGELRFRGHHPDGRSDLAVVDIAKLTAFRLILSEKVSPVTQKGGPEGPPRCIMSMV